MPLSLCTCGNHVNADDEKQKIPSSCQHQEHPLGLGLDASFVHLPAPTPSSRDIMGDKPGDGTSDDFDLFNQGILNTYRHINVLLRVAEGHLGLSGNNDDEKEADMDDHICLSCIERVAAAMDENTERLREETHAYEAAVENEKDKQRRLRKALSINAGINNDDHDKIFNENDNQTNDEEDILTSTLGSLQQEMHHLSAACQEHEEELQQLNLLLQEQAHIATNLTMQEEETMQDFHALEIDARAFQEVHAQLTHQCHAAERERYYLSQVHLHSALHDIVIDEQRYRGMMYPLINNLRLTHRPSPKGVTWLEINAAWSQAAQLIMFVGSTIQFKSRDLRIVPLTSCAKIIEVGARATPGGADHGSSSSNRKIVHHLGVDFDAMDRKTHRAEHIIPSIRVFHALLHQMIVHVTSLDVKGMEDVPFAMEVHSIGQYDLGKIHDHDDVAWSGVVNCIASNMKWLSQNASKCIPIEA